MPRIATEVIDYRSTDDGSIVEVEVTSLVTSADEFQELRARARALTATGFSSSIESVLDDVNLGEMDELTQTLEVKQVRRSDMREKKVFVVEVNRLLK